MCGDGGGGVCVCVVMVVVVCVCVCVCEGGGLPMTIVYHNHMIIMTLHTSTILGTG